MSDNLEKNKLKIWRILKENKFKTYFSRQTKTFKKEVDVFVFATRISLTIYVYIDLSWFFWLWNGISDFYLFVLKIEY